jgi:beta-lactamase class D
MCPRFVAPVLVLLVAAAIVRAEGPRVRETDLGRYFAGYRACFVMLDVSGNTVTRYNADLCDARHPPCSTFKVPNSLIGLQSGVIPDADTVVKWDGTRHHYDSWNRNQTLRTAVARSAVWYFQRLARGVGEARMRQFLRAIDYGNHDISGGIDTFWLNSTLTISANEQVEFLRKLAADELPFSRRATDLVKDVITLTKTDAYVLRGKTGTGGTPDRSRATLGWFVGYLTRGQRVYVFAINIQADDGATGSKARQIAEKILLDMKLLD